MTNWEEEAKGAHAERVISVKRRLKETGGVIQPWMYNVLYPEELRQIWASGDWI
jgi:hypothetical protein